MLFKYLKFWGVSLALLLPMHAKAISYSSDYLVCINSAGSSSTKIANCMKIEFTQQDNRLKSVFKKNLDLYQTQEKQEHEKKQKQWLKNRDSECGEKQKSVSDDYKMKYYNCALRQTLYRANMLEKLSNRL